MVRRTALVAAFIAATSCNAQSIINVLQSQPQLSLFRDLLNLNASLADLFQSATPQSILVPNNDAILKFVQENGISDISDIPFDDVLPLLSYHVLTKNASSEDIAKPGGAVIETKLTDPRYNLLKEGGQIIYGKPDSDTVVFESGLKEQVKVVTKDLKWDGGLIHIIDGLLTLPGTCSETIAEQGAEDLVRIIDSVKLLDTLDTTKGATCFAPEDSAIQMALPVLQNLTEQETKDVLFFHILLDPYYTDDLEDGMKIPTALNGTSITVNVRGGNYYFNGVKAKTVNDIAKNGVAYILEGVMSPTWNGELPDEEPTTTTTTSVPSPTGGANQTATETTTEPPRPTSTDDSENVAGMNSVGASILFVGMVFGMIMNA